MGVEIRAIDDDGSQIVRRLLPRESRTASSRIEPGADLDFGAVFLAAEFAPTKLQVEARFQKGPDEDEASTSIPVRILASGTGYGYPLRGSWYMRGIPSAMSHNDDKEEVAKDESDNSQS